ncbi:MAG: hypothetical protein L6R40_007667 [Gallowayella cf. fulva]|nr:MAG: hypothetical protein L6R40_007667 [Xanthomendoza cf. fulva]
MPKRHFPTVRVFEDGRTPPPAQVFFPHRRHSCSTTKTSGSTDSGVRLRQQTLTQITPSLSRFSTSFGSSDENSGLDFEVAPGIMPPKKKQRRSSNFPPQKQTITQMDPFQAQIYTEDDPLPLEQEDLTAPEPLPRRKKRKSTTVTPIARTVQTRSAKKRVAEADVKNEVKALPVENTLPTTPAEKATAAPAPESQQKMMLPPVTPKSTRRKEIPSSQSPAETPWSSHNKGSTDLQNTMPLGARSVNTPSKIRSISRRKTVQWVPKLEVANSTNLEDEDSQTLFPIVLHSQPTAGKVETSTAPPQAIDERSPPRSQFHSTPAAYRNINRPFSSDLQYHSSQILRKRETGADSDEEAEDPVGQSFGKAGDHEAIRSVRTPSLVHQINSASARESPEVEDGSRKDQTACQHQADNVDNHSFETVLTQMLPQPILKPKSTQIPSMVSSHLEDSETIEDRTGDELLAQSGNELLRSSSPAPIQRGPWLETESQFENAWRDYTPQLQDVSDAYVDEQEVESKPQAPQASLSYGNQTISSTDVQSLPPIPPSQASTTDATQPSIRRTQLSHQASVQDARSRVAVSPPSRQPALSSSSPFYTKNGPAADTYMGYQGWNGIPMTDSQLLPDSLLNDSLEMPLLSGIDEDLDLELDG